MRGARHAEETRDTFPFSADRRDQPYKTFRSDIVLSLHLSMSGRALIKPLNGRPLKILAASVQQWECAMLSAHTDALAAHLFTRHAYSIDTNVYDDDTQELAVRMQMVLIASVYVGTGSSNNYAYLVKDDRTNDAVIIDPANTPEYAPFVHSHRHGTQ